MIKKKKKPFTPKPKIKIILNFFRQIRDKCIIEEKTYKFIT